MTMRSHRYFSTRIFSFFIVFVLLTALGCGAFRKNDKKDQPVVASRAQATSLDTPKRLINDYRGMQEDYTISWFWLKPGFDMSRCRSVSVHPLKNFSSFEVQDAETLIQETLNGLFKNAAKSGYATLDINVMAAITDIKPKEDRLSRLVPFMDDYPFIEIELVIFEETTKAVLFKLCHYKQDEDIEKAISGLIEDLKTFSQRTLKTVSSG